MKVPLVLGSASPRRARILESLGIPFTVLAVDAEEIHHVGDPVHTVTTNARTKYRACRERRPDAAVIAADTLVWFEGCLIGKPVDMQEAARFLRLFSGGTQIVFSAVAMGLPREEPELRVEASSVRFRTLSEPTIREYLNQTRPLDRAGAYDIDENGDRLIAGYSGSYTNIMGLPVESVRDWLSHVNGYDFKNDSAEKP